MILIIFKQEDLENSSEFLVFIWFFFELAIGDMFILTWNEVINIIKYRYPIFQTFSDDESITSLTEFRVQKITPRSQVSICFTSKKKIKKKFKI